MTPSSTPPSGKPRPGTPIAFAVPAAFVFGDHLGFTAGYDAAMLGPVIAAKLTGGVLAVLAALLFTRKKPAQNM